MRPRVPRLGGLFRDESGATAVMIGVSMTALMGFAGMAIDVGLWYADRRAAQGAADSAAYSAATYAYDGDTASSPTLTAQAVAAGYGFTNGSGGVTVTVNNPPQSGAYTTNNSAYEVIVTKPESLFFSSLFLKSASVSARAVAVAGSSATATGKYCIQALDTSSSVTDISVQNGGTVNVNVCGMESNGAGTKSIDITGGSTVNAKYAYSAGGLTTENGGSLNIASGGSKTTSGAAIADPYANVTMPTAGTCSTYPQSPGTTSATVNGTSYTIKSYNVSGSSATLSPGTYCNGLQVTNGATVTLSPGVYVFAGGTVDFEYGTVNASGVTIVLTNGSTLTNYATFTWGNSDKLTLTAPTSGTTAGIAIFQDRNAPSNYSKSSLCNFAPSCVTGGGSYNITGAIYFPHQMFDIENGTNNNTSNCTQLIAYQITFTGGVTFSNTCSGTGTKGIGVVSTSTALVE